MSKERVPENPDQSKLETTQPIVENRYLEAYKKYPLHTIGLMASSAGVVLSQAGRVDIGFPMLAGGTFIYALGMGTRNK